LSFHLSLKKSFGIFGERELTHAASLTVVVCQSS
jgi:hypothetical protein